MDQLPRLGKRELICLLLFTCNRVVSVRRGFLFLCVLGMGCVILLWHSLCLPYTHFGHSFHICLDVKWSIKFWPELQLNKANTSDTEAHFFDLHLSISNGFVSSKNYDKRNDFDFDIVNFPFLKAMFHVVFLTEYTSLSL